MKKSTVNIIVGAIGACIGTGISVLQIRKIKKLQKKAEQTIKEAELEIEMARMLQDDTAKVLTRAEEQVMHAEKARIQYEFAKAAYDGAAKALF